MRERDRQTDRQTETERESQRQRHGQGHRQTDRDRAKETEGDVCDNSTADNPTGFLPREKVYRRLYKKDRKNKPKRST